MNSRVCRRLRRSVYGKGHHPGSVQYFIGDPKKMGLPKNLKGCCVADKARRAYQILKKAYIQGRFVL